MPTEPDAIPTPPLRLTLASDFSPCPAGRTRREGPHSAERFREDVLIPWVGRAMAEGRPVAVSFDGLDCVSSAFVEEAFGGAVRARPDLAGWLGRNLRFEGEWACHRDMADAASVALEDAVRRAGA